MGALLAFLIVVWAVKRFIADPIIDGIYAARGQDSPRMAAIRRDRAAGGHPARYGASDYFRDLVADFWEDMRAGRDAVRAAERADGRPVSWRERWRAAMAAMDNTRQRVADAPPVRRLIDPVGVSPEPAPVLPESEPVPAVPQSPPDVGTVRFTDTGRERWDGTSWVPVPEPIRPLPKPARPYVPILEEDMTAPTGEAVNVETTLAQLDAIDDALRAIDASVDVLDGQRAEVAAASEMLHASLTAKNLDGETLGGVSALLDYLDPDFVKAMIDKIEAAKAAVAATRAHVLATYADAANTVASTGINADYLAA